MAGQRRSRDSSSPAKRRTRAPRGAQHPTPPHSPAASAAHDGAESLRLGAIPGATPGRWIRTWHERMPHTSLQLVPLSVAGQRDALVAHDVDIALVRLPLDREGLHVIRLYDEIAVVLMSTDSHLAAVDTLDAADLAGQTLVVPGDDALAFTASGVRRPGFGSPATLADAIALVSAGAGIVVAPMSLARLHARRDVTYRPLRDSPTSTVALAWPADRTTPLVDMFVGIVRGRTANSSR